MIENQRSPDYLLEMNKTNHLFHYETRKKRKQEGVEMKEGNETEYEDGWFA